MEALVVEAMGGNVEGKEDEEEVEVEEVKKKILGERKEAKVGDMEKEILGG